MTDQTPPNSFTEIVSLWPTQKALAGDVGVAVVRVRAFKSRNSIPSEYWAVLVDAADRRKIDGVTLKILAAIAAAKSRSVDVGVRETAA